MSPRWVCMWVCAHVRTHTRTHHTKDSLLKAGNEQCGAKYEVTGRSTLIVRECTRTPSLHYLLAPLQEGEQRRGLLLILLQLVETLIKRINLRPLAERQCGPVVKIIFWGQTDMVQSPITI